MGGVVSITWRRGKDSGTHAGPLPGRAPAIVLCNPKYPHNVGQIVRLAACYGIKQVWITGDRVQITDTVERLPREERMRDYESVTLRHTDYPLNHFAADTQFVACEFAENSENLVNFVHDSNMVYVFGPEDGHVPKGVRVKCWRFIKIPTLHCLNLATAVATVLYDRHASGGMVHGGTELPSIADAGR